MLKISTTEDDQSVRLQLEGALAGSWVKELELSWRTANAALHGRSLCVDLTGTTRVDMAGHYLLKLMHKEGAHFLASGAAMYAVISEITGLADQSTDAQGRAGLASRASRKSRIRSNRE